MHIETYLNANVNSYIRGWSSCSSDITILICLDTFFSKLISIFILNLPMEWIIWRIGPLISFSIV